MTLKRPFYNLRRRRDREAALRGAHLVRGERVWWLTHEIWSQLAQPKGYRARLMAHRAAVVGRGRGAVLRVLERFLEEIDAALARLPRPRLRAPHRGGAEEADAAVRLAEELAMSQVIARFERILAGKPARRGPSNSKPSATVVVGPWSAGACPSATDAPTAIRQSVPTVLLPD